ncbi:phosphate-responsive 1 family protein [Actinidia rufa]|uniref:Phosphate-responsive 1 family protein n=1 Tax=Actinidia rufa TaxID=165716 RepID=A0A7J0E0W2_9ERIC|nr:phosphate-responsive 1 family protein [Actinidia rufa]
MDQPSVATWWKTTEKYYHLIKNRKAPSGTSLALSMGRHILDENYSFGKSLTSQQIQRLAAKGDSKNAINVVLTSSDVNVDGFCSSRCPMPGKLRVALPPAHLRPTGPTPDLSQQRRGPGRNGYQPGESFGWDRHEPVWKMGTIRGPQKLRLRPHRLVLGYTAAEHFRDMLGELLVDPTTGASYNAHGVHGRKYLLPALLDPETSSCSTLV